VGNQPAGEVIRVKRYRSADPLIASPSPSYPGETVQIGMGETVQLPLEKNLYPSCSCSTANCELQATAQVSTRIKSETAQLLRQLAARDRITMAEVIERTLELYAER
jgi:hypothetical protein